MKKMLTLCLVMATALIGQAQMPVVQSTTIPAVSAPTPSKNMKKAQYANQVTVDNIIYGIDTEAAKAVVLGADDDIFDLVIADQVTFNDVAYPVTEVNARAFMRNGTIETIQFPATMKYIGSWAFYEASALQSVTLPDGIEKTDTCCFRHCVSLESVDMGQGIKEVGYGTFSENPGLTSVVFPASVQKIGGYCVEKCPNLATITIQSPSLEYVGYSAFNETAITEIIFPETVTNMQMSVCRMCNNLKHVVLPTNLTAVPGQMFTLCAGLEEITLPESITTLSSEAFYGNEALRSINLDNITRYEHACLYETHALTGEIVFNENTTLIGDFAFRGSAISGIKTGANVETIDSYAFWACYNLKSIDLGEGLQAIGMGAFGDTRFSTIAFPSTVVDVEGYAVLQNPNLIALGCKAVDVPEMVNKLDLVSDYNATTLYVPEASIEAYKAAEIWQKFANVKSIDEMPMLAEYVQDGAIYELNLTQGTAILVDGKAVTGDYVVPNTITKNDVVCTVIGIANEAFNQNANLTGVTLNGDLQTIGSKAFAETNITALNMGAKVQMVGTDFHYKATKLATITVDENNPYLCAENSLLMTKDKKEVIGFPVANPATELIIPDEVELVRNDAVNRCKNLKRIVIGSGCKHIERNAFDNCTEATELILGDNIEDIGFQAFRSLKSVTELQFPKNLKFLYDYAFSFTWSLKEAVLPEGLEWLCGGALNRCDALERVVMPASLTWVGQEPFSNCGAMTELVSMAENPVGLTTELFNDATKYQTVTLYVPEGCIDNYRNANIWQKFVNIEEMPNTSIDGVQTKTEAAVEAIYTIDGKRLSQMQNGVNIVRMSDGTTRKIIK
ncbi:MAG: leucine-rich repeat domain-containing protein [Muribaculaceae bacterium]|nr:leucine-rich repeat domain-containing protein [Muribaculaceae bacterium]